jgi:superfamily II DNA or RNA helicase
VIAVPTGAGKTALALASPYLLQARRVLVVVPSRDLRQQIANEFRSERVLQEVGALTTTGHPDVMELTGRVSAWSDLHSADVVVALPNSISPTHYPDDPPPPDLFDLIVIDEAHHTPAPTWTAILDHFRRARSVLLTATPQRRDGKRVPGQIVYHFPLRQALDEGFYKPIRPELLDSPAGSAKDVLDSLIVERVVELAAEPAHATSAVLVRAATVQRAQDLATRYSERGLQIEVLHSRMKPADRAEVVRRLKAAELRAVAVVDMLGEGFDLPRLRIAAYHDKHKSSNATVQLLGRLVRADESFPQDSVLVSVRDQDVYPELRGAVRALWDEDADWNVAIPGLIDDEVKDSLANQEYAARFSAAPTGLAIESLKPLVRAVIKEVPPGTWRPAFADDVVPDSLLPGQRLGGETVLYAACTPKAPKSPTSTLLVVTQVFERPRWHGDPGLDSPAFHLHLVTWRPALLAGELDLVFLNTEDAAMVTALLRAVGAGVDAQTADPARLQDAFDDLDRISVSNVGVRNTYLGGRGAPSYKTFAGSSVDRGLRAADTDRGALGHAMAQIVGSDGTYTAGVATQRGKFWESRYVPLREYENHIADYAARYWSEGSGVTRQLLPEVSRGERVTHFPSGLVAAIELNPRLSGLGWSLPGGTALEDLDFRPADHQPASAVSVSYQAFDPFGPPGPVWEGSQSAVGVVTSSVDTPVRRGFGNPNELGALLTQYPPNIYYADGNTVIGDMIYDSRRTRRGFPTEVKVERLPWVDVNIQAETRATASAASSGISVHEALEQWLVARPMRERFRWVLCNDGKSEIADYLVVEMSAGQRPHVELWHAKASGAGTSGVRLNDMQVVVAQAIKSRRWITDRTLWMELGRRLVGTSSPRLTIVEGSERLLRVLCGQESRHPGWSMAERAPNITGVVGIVQPGLSVASLERDIASDSPSTPATQIVELLTVLSDAVGSLGDASLLASH